MKILVTGLCTLHWGRLEYGNVGNYYIIEPFFRELHRVFPEAEIVTTFQMTEEFCEREEVVCLPMDIYYSWSDHDVNIALKEYGIAEIYNQTGQIVETTPYLEQVMSSDLIIDISGEMWGDKANPVGNNRMLVNLLKMRVAQLLKKRTVLFAATVGPFSDRKTNELARITFENFSLVTHREHEATCMVKDIGFKTDNVKEFPCPSFLFEPAKISEMQDIFEREHVIKSTKPIVGMVVCGFNMATPPYDKWPRSDEEYTEFAIAVEHVVNNLGARVILMSHSNGFDLPPNFKLKPGRDYFIVKQLQQVIAKRGIVRNMDDVLCIDNAYVPAKTKAIISQFDVFVTGRMHASVGSVSQFVPTVFIMHGQGSKSTKIIGFASILGLPEYVCEPTSDDMIRKINLCFENRLFIRKHLEEHIPQVQNMVRRGTDALKELMETKTNV
ncbi:polysaccharide pyruvyl transferase family protein [Proteiniborus sp. MB09-C3]|uniref:polysaccharide pyruvyl transferase family protein n=1 Tax=Proteiniborus sp. MB09-C3 TaxID=3050072 RepID=UPI002553A01F|nr:polysaccharide pyruvyl transferase family protein [Proteiniborus sp. MB09-C3]WIV12038.1 polysaccharide pyruvyl transferase family protein [Proteiniborus sp. MB09-C3]